MTRPDTLLDLLVLKIISRRPALHGYAIMTAIKETSRVRMALGARRGRLSRLVAAEVFCMVVVGSVAGWALGMGSARYFESLLYGVKAAEPGMVTLPPLAILGVAVVATLPAVLRALRIQPAEILRSE